MANFQRITKPKAMEEIAMAITQARLADYAFMGAIYDGGEQCPSTEMGGAPYLYNPEHSAN